MQRGMGLVGAQHYIRVQVSRVVISVIQSEIALRIKDGGLAEIGIEACPNERAEAPEKVGQVGWRRFGLMRLHASKAVCNTRSGLSWRQKRSTVCRHGMQRWMRRALTTAEEIRAWSKVARFAVRAPKSTRVTLDHVIHACHLPQAAELLHHLSRVDMFQRDPRAGAFLGGDRVSGQDIRDQNGAFYVAISSQDH